MSRRLKNYMQSLRSSMKSRRGRGRKGVQGVHSEELEARVLYSADVPWVSSYVALVDDTESKKKEGDGTAALREADIAQQRGGYIVAIDSRVFDKESSVQADLAEQLSARAVDFTTLDPLVDPLRQFEQLLNSNGETRSMHVVGMARSEGLELGNTTVDTNYVLNRAAAFGDWRESFTQDGQVTIHAFNGVQFDDLEHVGNLLSTLASVDLTVLEDIDPDAIRAELGVQSQLDGTDDKSALDSRLSSVDAEVAFDAPTQGSDVRALDYAIEQQRVVAKNQAVVTVSNTLDTVNGDTSSIANLIANQGGDGISLREAITAANQPASGTGPHTIQFSVTGSGPHSITLLSELPEIVRPVVIDGATEPDYAGAPVIQLDLSSAGSADGLRFGSGSSGSTVRGLSITGASDNAIHVAGDSDSNTIVGNYLGVDTTGLAAVTGGNALIFIQSDSNQVGGSTAADRNVIAGGANGIVIDGGQSNTVSGNFIGTDATGNANLGLVFDGIRIENSGGGNVIGGATSAEGNVIAGTGQEGIEVSGGAVQQDRIENNSIGVSADGTTALGLTGYGISALNTADRIEIVDNIIAWADGAGVFLDNIWNSTIQGNIIGTDATLTQNWGVGLSGIRLDGGSQGARIGGVFAGEGNVIAHSGRISADSDGIGIADSNSDGNLIYGNSIYSSAGLGIDLDGDGLTGNDINDTDSGANQGQNYAVLNSAGVNASGNFAFNIDTTPLASGTYTIDFYASTNLEDGNVEGARYLGSISGISDGTASLNGALGGSVTLAAGEYVTLTTRDSSNNTSEFSNSVQATTEVPYALQVQATTNGGLEINSDGGNDTYLVADDGGAIFGGLSQLSFETQFSTQSTDQLVLASYATNPNFNEFVVQIRVDGSLGVRVNGGSGIEVLQAQFDFNTLRDGEDHAVAFTWDNAAGDWAVYVDGVNVASGTGYRANYTLDTGGTLLFGQEQDSVEGGFETSEIFSGTLSAVRLFSDVRTAAEISASHNATLPYDESGLIAQWRFDNLSSQGVVLEDVGANNLTVSSVQGFTQSTPELNLSVNETAANGTVVGVVASSDSDREARIATLLASDSSLVYNAELNQFYRLSNSSTDYSTAFGDAAAFTLNGVDGQLVTIRSEYEQQVVMSVAGGSSFFLGGSDGTVEGEWRWLDGSSDDDFFWIGDSGGYAPNDAYTNWLSGRPDGGSSQPIIIVDGSTGLWDDNGTGTFGFGMIEWDADDVLDQTDPLTYTIALQTEDGAFAIDADSGEITVADGSLLDFSGDAIHTLSVRTTDTDGNEYDEDVTVSLRSVVVDDSSPSDLTSGIELNSDGGNDAYLISNSGLAASLNATTFEILFAANNSPFETVFLSFNNATDDEFSIQINNPGGSLELDFGSGIAQESTAIDYQQALLDGEVHSLAVSWDSINGDWVVYIDGEYVDSGTGLSAGSALDTTNGQFVFGQEQDGLDTGYDSTQYFSGTIYDVRIWDQVRTAADIALNYQSALDVTPIEAATIGLVANWQMDGFNGSNEVVDVVGGNNLEVARVGDIRSWTNQVGGVTADGNTLTYVDDGAPDGWGSQINSANMSEYGFTDDYTILFTIDNTTNYAWTVGLGSTETNADFGDLEYAIFVDHIGDSNDVSIRHNGTEVGLYDINFVAGGEFGFYVNGTTLEYQYNGVTFATDTIAPATDWYVDTSFYVRTSDSTYDNQDDYSLSNFRVVNGSGSSLDDSTIDLPRADLHISENSYDGAVVGVVVPAEPNLSTDIVDDGSFNFAGASGYVNVPAGENIGGAGGFWTVVSGDVDIEGTFENAPLGGAAIGLDGTVPGAISQTIDTVAGQQYQVVFALSGNFTASSTLAELRVSADGQAQDFVATEPDNWSVSNVLWENRSFTFTADGSSTDLQFASLSASGGFGALISDVQVIQIPAAVSVILDSDPTLRYDAATDKFYRYVDSQLTFPAALANAISSELNGVSGQLVRIDSEYENELVRSMNTASYGAFIGASDVDAEGDFRWYEGSEPSDLFWSDGTVGSAEDGFYTNFNAPPDNFGDGQDYVVQRSSDGEWDDVTNTDSNHSIIEWDASAVLASFTYDLTDDAGGRFAIDESTGEITVADGSLLDFETDEFHDVEVRVTDASGNSYSESMTIAIDDSIDAQHSLPGSQNVEEDGTLDLTGADAITVSDGVASTNSLMRVTLTVTDGTLDFFSLTGITIVEGATSTSSITLDGTESDLNAALDGLTYTPNADFTGAVNLDVTTTLSAGLIAFYDFDEGALDSSEGRTYAGALNGDAAIAIDGTRGNVLSLDGDGDFVEVPGLLGEPDNVTISAWVDLTSTSAFGAVVLSFGGSPALYMLDDGSLFGFYESGGNITSATSTESLLNTGWRHVALTIDTDAQELTIYIDGVAIETVAATLPIEYDQSPNTIIGRSGFGGSDFDFGGQIDDLEVYDRALGADEIAAVAGNSPAVTGSVAITVDAANDAPTFAVGDGVATSFTSSVSDSASDLLLQDDGSLIVVGTSNDGGGNLTTLTRYLPGGSLDVSFGTGGQVTTAFGGTDFIAAGALQSDGRILVAGSTDNQSLIARFNADGTIDSAFGVSGFVSIDMAPSSSDFFEDVTIQDDGSIVAVGYGNFSGDERITVVRFDTDGNLDTTFNGTGSSVITNGLGDIRLSAVTVDDSGRIVGVGRSSNGSDQDAIILRFNQDGTLDTTFSGDGMFTHDVSSGGFDSATGVVVDGSGRIVIGGTTNTGNSESFALRVLDNGTLDTSFNATGVTIISAGVPHESVEDIAIQDDGRIVLAGSAYTNEGINDVSVIRLTDGGALDTSFDDDGLVRLPIGTATDDVSAVVIDHLGNIVVTGRTDGATNGIHVTRFNSDGQQDSSFNAVNTLDNNPTYIEGGAAVTLDGDVQVFDRELSELDDFGGATLTLVRNSSANGDDVFTASGNLEFNAGTLELSSTPIGTYSNTDGQLVITFAVGATSADVIETMRSIQYSNTNQTPPGSVQINWTFNDGNVTAQGTGGEQSATGSTTVNITATNSAPVLINNSLTISEGETIVLDDSDLSANDADNDDSLLTFTVSSVTSGQFELVSNAGLAITTFTQAQITAGDVQFVHNGGEAAPTYSVTVSDGSLSSGPEAATITFTNLNDAPVIGNNSLTVSEGETVVFDGSDLSATDADNDDSLLSFTVSVVTNGQFELVSNAGVAITTFTQAQITAGDVQFVHNGGEAAPTYSVTVSDGSLSDGPEAATITFTNLNDAPLIGNNSLTISEGETVIVDGSDLSATDADNDDSLLTFTVSIVTNGQFELVSNAGVAITTFTQAQITAGDVQFVHSGGEAAPTYSVTVSDGSLSDGPEAATITFTNLNDTPVIGNNSLTINEGETVVLNASDLSATDAETAPGLLNFTVSSVTDGQFELVSNAGVAITTFTQAQITAGDVQFVHNGGEAAPTYSVTVSDGLLSDGPEAATITFTNLNDTPVIGNNSLTINEGETVVLDATDLSATDAETAPGLLNFTVSSVTNGQFELVSNAGVAITTFTQAQIAAGDVQFVHSGTEAAPTYSVTVSDGSVSDGPEAATITFTNLNDAPIIGNNSLTINEGETVILDASDLFATDAETAVGSLSFTVSAVTNGQFELVSNTGVAITTFTQAQITAGDVQFVHGGGESAPAYSVTVSDGVLSDGPEAATITFTNANDAPAIGNNSLTISEGETVVLDMSDLSASDAETVSAALVFTVSSVTNGQFELASSAGVAITLFTQSQLASGDVQFVHSGSEAAPTYSVAVSDGSLSDGPQAATITFTNLNDAPEIDNNTLSINEGETVVLDSSSLSATDAETVSGLLVFSVSSVTNGQFELVSNAGVAVASFTQAQVAAGDVQFVHIGGEAAPTYSIAVSDGALSGGPDVATITFFNVNDAPIIGNNSLTISEGETVVLDASDLSASDAETAAGTLLFTVSNVTNGQFELVSNAGVATTSFTQAQLMSGDVQFVHGGGETAPTYSVVVGDGSLSDGPEAATITFSNVNDAPVIGNNSLTISEGETVVLDASDLSASDAETAADSLAFTVSNVTNGQFELVSNAGLAITAFTQAQVTSGDVQFVHSGGEGAPTYSVAVNDGSLGDGPQAALISFTNENDAPVIASNVLAIDEGGTVVLDSANISATDVETAYGLLEFSVSSVVNGQFEFVANPGVVTTTFTQAQINAGDVQFVHDGSELAPAFFLTVSDGVLDAGPQAGAITFSNVNDAPIIGNNALAVAEGETVVLTSSNLSATDIESAPGALTFSVSGITGGQFELTSNPGVATTVFTQAQIVSGEVQFVHDGGESAPAYSASVSDGSLTTGPASALINFTSVNDAPVLGNNDLTISEGETVVLTGFNLSATDAETVAGSLIFEVSNVNSGQFELVSNAGVAITAFTQAQITAGAVQFSHNGGELAPAYTVNVSDGAHSIAPQAADIAFTNVNDAPVLTVNALTIGEGETVTLGDSNLLAFDSETASGSLVFSVSDVTSGQFELIANAGVSVSTFTQAQLSAGAVQFIHNGGEAAPAYRVSVSDGSLSDGPRAATIVFTGVNDAPVLGSNTLGISEGGTVVLTGANLSATDADSADGALEFVVSDVTQGQFELIASPGVAVTSFSQDQVVAGLVQFVHFGGEIAPTYSVSVSDGALTDGPEAADVLFANVNDRPQLINNSLSIGEGETVVLSSSDLLATDTETNDGLLQYFVSNVAQGQFELISASGVAVTTFTQSQIVSGDVQFVHDGFNDAPTYSVTVSDGIDSLGPAAAQIGFQSTNDAPELLVADIPEVSENSLFVTSAVATDADNDSLEFSLAGGEDAARFALDAGSGNLSFIEAPDYEFANDVNEDGIYEVIIAVDDGQGGRAEQAVFVSIVDVNEAPEVTQADFTMNLADNSLVVGQVAATDPDSNDQLSYSLLDTPVSQLFEVDAQSGQIKAVVPELGDGVYVLQVEVVDANGLSSTAEVKINIWDSSPPRPAIPAPVSFEQQPVETGPISEEPSANAKEPVPQETSDEGTRSERRPEQFDPNRARTPGLNIPLGSGLIDSSSIAEQVQRVLANEANTVNNRPTQLSENQGGLEILIKQLLSEFQSAAANETELSLNDLTLKLPKELIAALDQMVIEQLKDGDQLELKVSGAVMGSVSLSAGFIIWVLRAGSLMGSFLASRPLWATIDPLPIFGGDDEDNSREGV